jgi:hypothetical protein
MMFPSATSVAEARPVDNRTRVLLLAVREALLLILGAVEDYLEMPRTKKRGG